MDRKMGEVEEGGIKGPMSNDVTKKGTGKRKVVVTCVTHLHHWVLHQLSKKLWVIH